MELGTSNILQHFRNVPLTLGTQELSFSFFAEIRDCEQHYGKTDERILPEFAWQISHLGAAAYLLATLR